MKQLMLAGTAFLALTVPHLAAQASPIVFDFTYTGSLVTFTVPTTDTYQILAFGAQGGDVTVVLPPPSLPQVNPGGRGAEIGGNFSLTAGEVLQIAVGGAGMAGTARFGIGGGGGGGGSFVVGVGNVPLVIAGGGGGAGATLGGFIIAGGDGLTGPNGGTKSIFPGGTAGNGGGAVDGEPGGSGGGGGGGGFLSAGENGGLSGGGGGQAFPILTGGVGFRSESVIGGDGGFGGGGGGSPGVCGGGGGGYSGGAGGGPPSPGACVGGGGGGSFDAGDNQILVAGFQTGNGEVIITELAAAVPEPASIALLGAGLLGLTVVRRRGWRS